MASAGPNSPSTGATGGAGPGNNVIGAWTSTGNIVALDATYASSGTTTGFLPADSGASLIVSGSRAGSSLSTGTSLAANTSVQAYVYGGATVLWGLSLSVANVNSSTFGFSFAASSAGGSTTNWINATGFGFSIPAGATIDGVSATVYWRQSATSGQRSIQVDYVSMTVYYTASGGGGSQPSRTMHQMQMRRAG